MTWTPERIAKMRELFEKGCTSREIAAQLGADEIGIVTRNAVCGKLDRMGLNRKKRLPKTKVATMTAEQHDDHLKALARKCREDGSSLAEIGNWIGRTKDWVKWHTRSEEDIFQRTWMRKTTKERFHNRSLLRSRPCTLFELKEWSCRYPIGDPKHSNFRFCGAARLEPYFYCSAHQKMTHSSGTWSERAATRAP